MQKSYVSTFRPVTFFTICLMWLLSACAHHTLSVNDVSGPYEWGSSDNVMQLKHLYIAGQPDEAGLLKAKSTGVTTVINMRTADESSWDEQAYVEGLGMKYINIPVSGKLDKQDREAFAKVEAAIKEQQGAPVLLHCASDNRVSAWLADHLYRGHGLSQENAIAIARRTGLSKQVLEGRLETLWAPQD